MRKLTVPEKYNNKKLTNFLLDTFNNLNINTIYKVLRKKDIRINDVKISENIVLRTNDTVTVFISDEILLGNSYNFEIVYEDDNILIVNKPSGISVTENSSLEITLTDLLNKKYNTNNIKPCHRLDRNTKGLILFAKNENALNILLDSFKNKEIEKYYKCLVYGILSKKQATLTAYLFKDTKKSFVYISDMPKSGYQKIITSYKVLYENEKNNTSTLEIKLETRKNASN